MNSIQKSDSEQSTESKLSRVHSAPNLGLACAHKLRALCPSRPCRGHVVGLCPAHRGLWPAVSRPCCRPGRSSRRPGHVRRFVIPPHVAQLLRCVASLPALYRGALLRCITAQCHHITTQSRPLNHDTICVMTQLPVACTTRRVVHTLCRIAGPMAVSWPAAPSRGAPVRAVS